MVLSQRTRLIAIGVLGAVAAFFMFGGLKTLGGGSGSGEPYDAVPRDSFLVAQVNLAELRRSPLYEVLLGKDSPTKMPKAEVPIPILGGGAAAKALGMDKLAEACGFDPLSRVESMALAVPEEGDKGELGLAARVNVTRDELSRCTTQLASQRGGKVETKDVGSFVVAEDTSESSREAARPRLAYGHGSLLVVGRGAWFDAMLEAADAKKPSVREAQGHAAMRASLTSRDDWRSPTVLITALLPRSLRDRIKSEMGAELDSKDTSQSVMAGVLSVSSVGLALRAGTSGGTIDGAIELVCDPSGGAEAADKACAAVEKLISKKRLEWGKELMLRMVGFGPLLDSIEVKRDGARIRVTAGASADALASTLDRVLRLQARRQGGGSAPAPNEPDNVGSPMKRGVADENIPASPTAPKAAKPPSAPPPPPAASK